MRVVPNGVDTGLFKPDSQAGLALRSQWGVATGEKLAGLVGRIDPMKDHATFLKAGALAMERFPGLRLVCVGGGDEGLLAQHKEMAVRLGIAGRVIWTGPLSDMQEVYNAPGLIGFLLTG